MPEELEGVAERRRLTDDFDAEIDGEQFAPDDYAANEVAGVDYTAMSSVEFHKVLAAYERGEPVGPGDEPDISHLVESHKKATGEDLDALQAAREAQAQEALDPWGHEAFLEYAAFIDAQRAEVAERGKQKDARDLAVADQAREGGLQEGETDWYSMSSAEFAEALRAVETGVLPGRTYGTDEFRYRVARILPVEQ